MATLIAPSNHSPVEDAEAIRNAFKGYIIWLISYKFVSFQLRVMLYPPINLPTNLNSTETKF